MDPGGAWQEAFAETVNFKSTGVVKHLASGGLIKGELNGVIAGYRSHLVVKAPVTFILYIPEGKSPLEYQLLRFHVDSESREFRSAAAGGATHDSVDFQTRKIAPRAYEIVLGTEVGKGEYGILPPVDAGSDKNAPTSAKIYTFSVIE
jgi:hypothetical protein